MKKYRFVSLILVSTLTLSDLIFAKQVAAQEPMAFGEIKPASVVQIESSTGKWADMQDMYPLLKNTKIRTKEGIAAITTKDGSKIDLSMNTEAAINSLNGSYTINLTNGTISFNITPSMSLTIMTKEATISVIQQVGGYYSLVAGVGAPAFSNTQGMVFNNDKGTLIRSISGRINVGIHGLQPRTLNSGESLFASLEGNSNKGMIGNETGDPRNYSKLFRGLIIGTFFTTGTVIAFDSFRGGGVASPSGF